MAIRPKQNAQCGADGGSHGENPPSDDIFELFGLAEMRARCQRLALADVPLLILGETGAGKSTVAQWIHRQSPRFERRCSIRGCGTFHDQSFIATLFGYEKGAYTGAERSDEGLLRGCDGGTLILDDIDALSIDSQTRLLQFIDRQTVTPLGAPNTVFNTNVRILATSNRDLSKLLNEGAFREDLYYRLATFRLSLPPIRNRKIDVSLMARRLEKELALEFPTLSPQRPLGEGAIRLLKILDWPGNIRELKSVVYQTLTYASPMPNAPIEAAEFFDLLSERDIAGARVHDLRTKLNAEGQQFLPILQAVEWNVSLAAKIAGISRPSAYNRIEKYGWRRERDC